MSGDNITYLHVVTDQPISVARVLDAAKDCAVVLVLGERADGSYYAASSGTDKGTYLFLIEQFRHKLLAGDFG